MRCMPSSRSFCENRGVSLFARPSGDSGPGTFSLSRIDSANTQRRPVFDNAPHSGQCRRRSRRRSSCRCESLRARRRSTISLASSPCSRLPGCTVSFAEFGNPKSSLKPRCKRRGQVRVAVDQAGEERLAAPVVDIRVRIALEDLIGRADRRDLVADNGQRHVVLHGVGVDDGRVAEHDRPVAAGCCACRPRGSSRSAAAPAPAPASRSRRVIFIDIVPRLVTNDSPGRWNGPLRLLKNCGSHQGLSGSPIR